MTTEQTFTEGDLRQMVLRLAHEIRNPLATIQSAVQLLEHLQKPQGETAEFYQSIYVEVTRIDQVVRDMQRFVRLDAPTVTRVSVAAAVRKAIEAVVSGRDAQVRVQVRTGPTVHVLMDGEQLEAAITELLDNAIRFSAQDSTIRIAWRLTDHGSVAIDVDDEGPGIAAEDGAAILRPFFSSSTQGTGLGLNIVSRACRLAGGSLEWHPREPGGTRFTILLPVAGDG